MDNLVLVHSFRKLTFRDEFFDNKEFEIPEEYLKPVSFASKSK